MNRPDAPAAAPAAFSPEVRRFVRFLAVGGLNTAFGYSLFAAFVLLGLGSGPALAAATVLGIAFNFRTTGRIVFASRDDRRLPRFLAVYAAQFLLNWSLLRGLEAAGMSPLLAQLILVGPIAVATYLMMAKFVFPASSQPGGGASRPEP
jgi:putative flippase GtrA